MRLRWRDSSWTIWISFVLGLILSVIPMPEYLAAGRPLWVALLLVYWTLYMPHRVGMTSAWLLGLALDVLNGTLLGENALVLVLISFQVQSLQQRLRMFPQWQQSMMLLVVFGLAQLVQLWLLVLTGDQPPPILTFLLPALVSALLWPWLHAALGGLRMRFRLS